MMNSQPIRRTILCGSCFLAVIFAASARAEQDPPAGSDRPYLTAALEAARWIKASEVKTGDGLAWPIDPTKPEGIATNLYSGTAGIVLFFVEAYYSTSDRSFLADAEAGADYIIAKLPTEPAPAAAGLYTGVAGMGFTLEEVYKASGKLKYRDAAKRCLDLIHQSAKKTESGVTWSGVTDIIGGSAGTGLYLLEAVRTYNDSKSLELAEAAGKHLIAQARREKGGMNWAMSPSSDRFMPNFSHGTAGISYFLHELYRETDDQAFLEAALAGARYIESVAKTDDDRFLLMHHQPGGEDLFYLGWCHGPVGTARLFQRLGETTGDRKWQGRVAASALAVLHSGIPEKRTPGFWNNISQCCGSAGVAQFFLNLHQRSANSAYLEFSRRLTADLLSRGSRDPSGLKWVQSEHRVRPELLVAQTGYMQGSAGVGLWLLRLDAFEQGKRPRITFPDSPF